MNMQIWLFFLVLSNSWVSVCQVVDDFSGAGGIDTSIWSGDLDDFTIGNGQLQLNTDDSGVSSLWAKSSYVDQYSFEIDVRMDFAPSGRNRTVLYLWSESANLSSRNALYLKLGESGTNDNIQLYERIDGVDRRIAEGIAATIASDPVEVRILVTIIDDQCSLRAIYNRGVVNTPEIMLSLPSYSFGSGYMGIVCHYTKTRSDRFFFDNVYAGKNKEDFVAPKVMDASVQRDQIRLSMSETLDESATQTENYLIKDIEPVSVEASDFSRTIILQYPAETLKAGTIHSLSVSVADLAGNPLDTTITLLIPDVIEQGDLLINELLFNPKSSGADYLEIINVSDKTLSTTGLTLSNTLNGGTQSITTPSLILPGHIICWTADPIDIASQYPSAEPNNIYLQKTPSWSNKSGNVTLRYGDQLIDTYNYDESHHHQLLADVDGVSLERISVASATDDPSNWTSSTLRGTPGSPNSVKGGQSSVLSFELEHKTFSPDGDGDRDELILLYATPSHDYVATIKVFSERGHAITTLQNNQPIIGSGQIKWDGRDKNGRLAPIGIYILLIDGYSLSGERFIEKLPFVLAGRF